MIKLKLVKVMLPKKTVSKKAPQTNIVRAVQPVFDGTTSNITMNESWFALAKMD